MKAGFYGTALAAAFMVIGALSPLRAQSPALPWSCTIMADAQSGDEILRQGVCDQPVTPMSSFKLPLAVMGFDSGILTGPHDPVWPINEAFNPSQRERAFPRVDPEMWERESLLWFSQELTTRMGMARFAGYVQGFGYGNGDLSGRQGDGLTRSWLSSSLRISPEGQVGFLHRFLTGDLPVTPAAIALTRQIIPQFDGSDGWQVQGKTGSGWLRDGSDRIDRSKPVGWFVGWAEKDGRQVVFAEMLVAAERLDRPGGFVARDRMLARIGDLMAGRE
ncbi:class D beta-lactamase [Szabonella alba]|uniref:Class D beta-lactamase n=1 Tax=Szabonella alba TaxID=2804194 RepID=A0A8K0V6I4_9RHOB|nr:class D beta-lactamase [Szabonella alba]MBL4916283.1 class D beta-lactamase [Szabonella alba]